jgi:hypothetical protein
LLWDGVLGFEKGVIGGKREGRGGVEICFSELLTSS